MQAGAPLLRDSHRCAYPKGQAEAGREASRTEVPLPRSCTRWSSGQPQSSTGQLCPYPQARTVPSPGSRRAVPSPCSTFSLRTPPGSPWRAPRGTARAAALSACCCRWRNLQGGLEESYYAGARREILILLAVNDFTSPLFRLSRIFSVNLFHVHCRFQKHNQNTTPSNFLHRGCQEIFHKGCSRELSAPLDFALCL